MLPLSKLHHHYIQRKVCVWGGRVNGKHISFRDIIWKLHTAFLLIFNFLVFDHVTKFEARNVVISLDSCLRSSFPGKGFQRRYFSQEFNGIGALGSNICKEALEEGLLKAELNFSAFATETTEDPSGISEVLLSLQNCLELRQSWTNKWLDRNFPVGGDMTLGEPACQG